MPLVIGVLREAGHGEKRVAVVPEVVKKFKALSAELCIEQGAGDGSFLPDKYFGEVSIAPTNADVFARSHVILKVQPPAPD